LKVCGPVERKLPLEPSEKANAPSCAMAPDDCVRARTPIATEPVPAAMLSCPEITLAKSPLATLE
jgi:hypothetical protein